MKRREANKAFGRLKIVDKGKWGLKNSMNFLFRIIHECIVTESIECSSFDKKKSYYNLTMKWISFENEGNANWWEKLSHNKFNNWMEVK